MQTVIAAFQDRAQAERARDQLVQRGIDREDVHIEMPQATEPLKEESGGSGGISGFFSNLFGSDDDFERHGRTWNEAVRHGHPVIVVDASDERQAQEAASCLQGLGAMDIDKHAGEWNIQGRTSATSDVAKARDTSQPARKDGVLDVVQEELHVGKRTVSQGGVRVIQRVSSKPVREVLRLREERAVVERRPVNRQASAGDLNAFKEGTMEVRESAEEAVVSKGARVVEEVRVGKDVREREQVVEDTLRRKDVDVERIGTSSERERAAAADSPTSGAPSAGSRKKNNGNPV
jgi:uncharacterized protein (TIGR02271 family)